MRPPVIIPHASLEALKDALMAAIHKAQCPATAMAALRPVPVIVPSIQFTDWLQVAIAKNSGLCMGLEFMMPQGFIQRALRLAASAAETLENPWSKRNLTWRLLPHIKDCAGQLGVREPSPRDRLALAGLLADQFDQYGHFRPEFIAKWNQGKAATADRENEEWQRRLWRQVQSEINAHEKTPHPALALDDLAGKNDFLKSLNAAFPRLFVAGTGALDPLLVRVLQLLGKAGCDVQTHVVLPSLAYLGELRKSPRITAQDPENLGMRDGHPLLVSMGRHAVGSFLLLGELDENYTHWPDAGSNPEETAPPSLLRRLQSDIRQLRTPSGTSMQSGKDISLRVHSCYGPRREMEVLRDELLRAFSDIEDLKPDEVIVATPSLETYAPLVAAVFGQSPPLPVRLTELPPSEQYPATEGLLALLEMAGGKCEASSLLELLHLRSVRACLGIPDDSAGLERLRDWIFQSGLTRGLDGEGDPSGIAMGSWRFARDRMIAGKWFGAEDCARYPEGGHALPVADDLGGGVHLKQAFLGWHWRLSRTLREWRAEAPPSEWAERLGNACDQLLSSPDDEDARLEIQPALNFLAELGCAEAVDAAAIFDWLQSEAAESGRRTKVSGRVTFGRLKQVQNIPCRVLAMVGMQDGAFPRQNRIPAWDLLHLDPRAWDRNARTDDRQLFLDAVLTPTDRLIITASTRNVRSGKTEPFSTCVDELLRVVQAMTPDKGKPLVQHRLQPFAPDYFGSGAAGDALPRSFDSNSATVAKSFLKGAADAPFWNQDSPCEGQRPDEPMEITVDQLAKFWKDPAQAFLRAQGITPHFDEENDELLDRAPLGLDGLQQWSVKDAIVQDILEGGTSLDHTKALLLANRGLPPSELGNLQWNALHRIAEPLGRKIREIKTDPLLVDFPVPGTSPAVRITGSMWRGKLADGEALLACRVGKFKDAKNFLRPWIESIAATCAGHSLRTCVLDAENLGAAWLLEKYAQQQATELLGHLIAGFLQGQSRPLCYAPQASDAYANACRQWETPSDEAGLRKASDEWNQESNNHRSGGEGDSPAAKLAWRDQDPFTHAADWHQWARAIAKPLREWFKPEKPRES
jgi:exodeoxyribonuclease V gamma subunit